MRLSKSFGFPINTSTCSKVMPSCSWANLLPGTGMPTISPTIDPSADFTALPCTFDPVDLALSAEDLVVSTFCRDAQPDRATMHTTSTSQFLRHIKFSHPRK